MPQKIRLLTPLRPEADGIRKRMHSLRMPANKRAAEIYLLEIVLLGVEVRDLADVVGDGVQEGAGDVFGAELCGGGVLVGRRLFGGAGEVVVF